MSRSSVAKQGSLESAPEVIPILKDSCARLKKLLALCDQQIDSIAGNSELSGPAKVKEIQILVRMVLSLQKDLVKYTKALHPDIPVKQQPQAAGKVPKEDWDALSDSQLHEIMAYFVLDEDEREMDIQDIIDDMLNRPRGSKKTSSEKAPLKTGMINKPSSKQKANPVKLKVQPREIDARKTGLNRPVQGNTGHGTSMEHHSGKPENRHIRQQAPGEKLPDNWKRKPPSDSTDDPHTE